MKLAHPDRIQRGMQWLQQLQSPGRASIEFDNHHQRPDGSRVWIHLTIAPVSARAAGESQHLCMVQDITERRQADEVMRSSNAILSRFNALAVGRELRMVELKRDINALCAELGRPPRHRVVDPVSAAQDGV